jgi:SAM-dependent methyltransferase
LTLSVRGPDLLRSGLLVASLAVGAATADRIRRVEYTDLPDILRRELTAYGIPAPAFDAYIERVQADTDRRVAEGEREHLIYYALQSRRFSRRPPIEPATSARGFIEHLPADERSRLMNDPSYLPKGGWPPAERARLVDLLSTRGSDSEDARLAYFRTLVDWAHPDAAIAAIYADYVRTARFLYRKEFAAGNDAATIASLYESRAHSSDTQIEAGLGVYLGLGTLRALDPALRVKRILVVGPGLDFAPRTELLDAVEPQSYQPFAVADALLALSLASESDLQVHAIDVNPRVVRAIESAVRRPLALHLLTGILETSDQPFTSEYRAYLQALGRAIGDEVKAAPAVAADRHYRHSIAVRPAVERALSVERLNIVTERLVGEPPFDIAIATNVLAYFDDRQLALALSNITAMLRPGGYLLHNESRDGLVGAATALGLPLLHARTALLGGSPSQPFYDTVWLHQKSKTP